MNFFYFFNFVIVIHLAHTNLLEIKNTLFVIVGQNNEYNKHLANEFVNDVTHQVKMEGGLSTLKLYISYGDSIETEQDWLITPLLPQILNLIEEETKWILFLEDRTIVNLARLNFLLAKLNSSEEILVGHALHDSEGTIIHHFVFYDDPTFFKYPLFSCGFVMSVPFFKTLSQNPPEPLTFHIDPAHELALHVYKKFKYLMQHDDLFCEKNDANCATYPKKFERCGTDGGVASVYFAIKTCQKYHKDRLTVVKNTWHKYVAKSGFFSDVEDQTVPTINLGVPNTAEGHCQKTMAILRYIDKKVLKKDAKLQWIALVDDDTILSVAGILSLISCHSPKLPLILGERYRFGVDGFNYPTGGAGILISKPALYILAKNCECGRPDSPDDMTLGACAQKYQIPLVHVPQMHQARPLDYAQGRLATRDAITFHKHWMIDPVKLYEEWFLAKDKGLSSRKTGNNVKVEL